MYPRAQRAYFFCRRASGLHHKLKNRKSMVRGASAILISATAGGALLYYESANLHEALGVVSQSKVIEHEKLRKPSYIYLSELDVDFDNNQSGGPSGAASGAPSSPKRQQRSMAQNSKLWFSWLQSRSRDPKTLLRLAQSEQHSVRLLGVQALAAQHHWHDSQYLMVAQACDSRTLVGLARSEDVDLRFFLAPPTLPPATESLEDELRCLLGSLPVTEIDKCTQYFTSHALAEGKVPSEERGGMWCFGGNGLPLVESVGKIPDEMVELFCLQAITRHSTEAVWSFDGSGLMRVSPTMTDTSHTRHISNCLHAIFTHSKVPSHCPEIVRHNGLQILQRIYKKRGDSLKICRNIARILSNIALQQAYHQYIIASGWVTILASWMKSPDLALRMLASKALANLDGDFGGGKYSDGIHLYHPQHRYREPVYADVVFVHGLLGGPFKTWRQKDPAVPTKGQNGNGKAPVVKTSVEEGKETSSGQEGSAPKPEVEEPTDCWPKDWLAKEYPHMRLLTLEYDTHLTEWAPKCPFESEKRSLAHRSNVILKKLKEAGLGKRPIIWIGHSMGGLIIKNVLVLAQNDPELHGLVDNSRGIVFYGTPHLGSPLAARSAQTRYLLYPSVEVDELVQGSEMLTTLHESFKALMFEKGIPLLSFGEGKKSELPLSFKLTLVPPESSNPGFGEYHLMEDMNHLEICKPESRNSPLYQLTLEFIGDCIPQNLIDHILKANVPPEDFVLSDMMN